MKTEPPIILSVNPISNQMFQIRWRPREKLRVYHLMCMLRFRTVNSTHWVSYHYDVSTRDPRKDLTDSFCSSGIVFFTLYTEDRKNMNSDCSACPFSFCGLLRPALTAILFVYVWLCSFNMILLRYTVLCNVQFIHSRCMNRSN